MAYKILGYLILIDDESTGVRAIFLIDFNNW